MAAGVLPLVLAVALTGCRTTYPRAPYGPLSVGELNFAGVHCLHHGHGPDGPTLWIEEFTFSGDGSDRRQCRVASKWRRTRLTDGRNLTAAGEWVENEPLTWGLSVSADGVTFDGVLSRTYTVPFIDVPNAALSKGDQFPVEFANLATVVDVEDVQVLGGIAEDCLKVAWGRAPGWETTVWVAPEGGVVRCVVTVKGVLVSAGAVFLGEEPDVNQVVKLLGWPGQPLAR